MKNTEIDSKLRPLYLLNILRDRTDEDHTLTTNQLINILKDEYGIDAFRTTIKSDVQMLQKAGYSIQETRSTQNRYNYIERDFDVPEVKLLIDAVMSSKFITKSKSDELAAKLRKLASPFQAEELKRNLAVDGRIKAENEQVYLIMDAINEAINRGRKISLQMTEYNDRKERVLHNGGEVYVFSPYSLVWDGDCYYVVGWSDKYNGMGSHRVDRIYRRPEILKEDIVPPAPDFDINEYINTMFRMYNAPRKEVLLEVESGLMDAIVDKFGTDVDVLELHEKILTYDEAVEALRQYIDARIKGEDVGENGALSAADPSETPGCFHVRAKVAVGTVFYNWIFGFGGKVKIIEPEEVREKYRELLQSD